ncbi:MAG: ribonuclease III [Firmicutes bacterium]|nr:ribonuclease III [Bacillota bacterium]MCD7832281.1 ribonuclease III [Bacillota bacterium]
MKDEYGGAALAYIGDAVTGLWVRELLLSHGITKTSVCSELAVSFVSAKAQSEAYENIRDALTEEEHDTYRRGRNAHVTVPKSATSGEYHSATGFEALFGALWLDGQRERADELLTLAYKDKISELEARGAGADAGRGTHHEG